MERNAGFQTDAQQAYPLITIMQKGCVNPLSVIYNEVSRRTKYLLLRGFTQQFSQWHNVGVLEACSELINQIHLECINRENVALVTSFKTSLFILIMLVPVIILSRHKYTIGTNTINTLHCFFLFFTEENTISLRNIVLC